MKLQHFWLKSHIKYNIFALPMKLNITLMQSHYLERGDYIIWTFLDGVHIEAFGVKLCCRPGQGVLLSEVLVILSSRGRTFLKELRPESYYPPRMQHLLDSRVTQYSIYFL